MSEKKQEPTITDLTVTYLRKNLPIVVGGIIIASLSSVFTFGITAGSQVLGYDSAISANTTAIINLTAQNEAFRQEYKEDFSEFKQEVLQQITLLLK